MSKVYIVTTGDFYDYDASAPGGVFSTREKALEAINSSIQFFEQPNYGHENLYRCYYSAEWDHIYEFNLDEPQDEPAKKEYFPSYYADIIIEHPDSKTWRP